MNYYQFHISDWALHTSHLTLEEEGVYRRLLDFYYDTEKPIPKETQPVIRRLRLGLHSETVSLILNEFFHLEEDGWHNNRADIEIAQYQSNAERARENGKKGGRPKKDSGSKTQLVVFANPEETGSKANQEPRTINHEPLTKNEDKDITPQAADSDSVSEIFSHWKTIMNHPRAKLDEKRRKKIREALKLGYTLTDLIAAIDGCAKSPYHMGQDGRNFTVYDDLELILRDAKHIDQFLKINSMPKAPMASQPKFDPVAYVNKTQGATQRPIDNPDLPLRIVGNGN